MTPLARAFALAFAQLGDRAIVAVLAKSVAITVLVFAMLGFAAGFGFAASLERAGIAADSSLGALLALLTTLIAVWLLFRIVALAVIQFFADDIVRAVEARHYPAAAAHVRALPLREDINNSVKGAVRALLVNLAALPFALALLVTGVGTALLFWAVNAWLLGGEFHDMVWLRHRQSRAEVPAVPGVVRFLHGGVVAVMLAIPFVNLIAPVLGAASAAHLVHRARKGSHAT